MEAVIMEETTYSHHGTYAGYICTVLLLTAAQFISAVPTVVVMVTYIWQSHTVPVGAFKLLQCAGGQRGLPA